MKILMRFILLSFFASATAHSGEPMALLVNMNLDTSLYCDEADKARGCHGMQGELALLQRNARLLGVKKENVLVIPPWEQAIQWSRVHSLSKGIENALIAVHPALKGDALKEEVARIREKGFAGLENSKLKEAITKARANPALSEQVRLLNKDALNSFQNLATTFAENEKKSGPIDQQIRRALDRIKEKNGKLDMLSLSGHSVGNEIFGESGYKLFPAQVRALIKDHPELVKDPRRIALPGCYTYTSQEFRRWQNDLGVRQDSLIVGWNGKGRNKSDSREWAYLNEMFEYARKMDATLAAGKGKVLTVESLKRGLRALNSVNKSKAAAASYCGIYLNVENQKLSCGEQWETFYSNSSDFESRYYASNAIPEEDPPKDTQSSPLRSFYDFFERICPVSEANLDKESAAEFQRIWNDARDRAIRTIHWENVRSNFLRCQANDIHQLNEALRQTNLPKVSFDEAAGRRGFMRSYLALKKTVEHSKEKQLQAVATALKQIEPLALLDASIPLPWVEPTHPRCD